MNQPENHEEENLILGPELHFLIHGRRHRVDNFLKIIDSWSYIEFKRRLRLPRQITIKLIGIIIFLIQNKIPICNIVNN